MRTNFKKMLADAYKDGYAVTHINILNLEWTKAVLETAKETRTPVILGSSVKPSKFMGGFLSVRSMVDGLIESLDIDVPVVLHLDHGDYESCLECIKCGYNSIMFDGSKLSFDENMKKTEELVNLAHKNDMTLEAEVGSVGGVEDGIVGRGEIADIMECKMLVSIGIDALACGIGNIHGKYPENWQGLDFETLKTIRENVGDMPLVLHGGSGIPDDMVKKAIKSGIQKVNVNTECHIAFANALSEYFTQNKDKIGKGYELMNVEKDAIEAIKDVVRYKFVLCGVSGKNN